MSSNFDAENSAQTLGYSKTEWVMFLCDAMFFHLLLLWPAIKTLATIDQKEGLGRTSFYWISIAPIYGLHCIIHFICKRWVVYGFIEVAYALILSYNEGSLVKMASKYVSKFYCKYATYFQELPDKLNSAFKKVLSFPFKLISLYLTSSNKDE